MNVLVIGASRGIGYEFVRQYRADRHHVSGTARDDAGLARLGERGAQAVHLDVTDERAPTLLASQLDGRRFDVVIVCAGAASSIDAIEAPDKAAFDHVMHANVLGPMRLMRPIADVLVPGGKLAVVSSRMGSIGHRRETDKWVYRASKAALNSMLKDVSLVLGDRAVCISLHPGWVRTDMGGADADIDVVESVSGMRQVIESSGRADTGGFRNHDGAPIAW